MPLSITGTIIPDMDVLLCHDCQEARPSSGIFALLVLFVIYVGWDLLIGYIVILEKIEDMRRRAVQISTGN